MRSLRLAALIYAASCHAPAALVLLYFVCRQGWRWFQAEREMRRWFRPEGASLAIRKPESGKPRPRKRVPLEGTRLPVGSG